MHDDLNYEGRAARLRRRSGDAAARAGSWLASRSFRARVIALLAAVSLVQIIALIMTWHGAVTTPIENAASKSLAHAIKGPLMETVAREQEAGKATAQRIAEDPAVRTAMRSSDSAAMETALDSHDLDRGTHLYITGAGGEVVAGQKPDGEVFGMSDAAILVDGTEVGSIHAAVELGPELMAQAQKMADATLFVAIDDVIISARGEEPRGDLAAGRHEVELHGTRLDARVISGGDGVLLGAGRSSDEAGAATSILGAGTVSTAMLLAALMALVGWRLVSALRGAMGVLAGAADQIAGGDLSARIPVVGADEVAQVSTSFNSMAAQLTDRIASLDAANARVRLQLELVGNVLAAPPAIGQVGGAICTAAVTGTGVSSARLLARDEDGRWRQAASIGAAGAMNAAEEAAVANTTGHGLYGGPGALAVTITSEGDTVGVFSFGWDGELAEGDQALLVKLARQVGVALENVRLHEQLREQATRDALTTLPNHRAMQEHVAQVVAAQADGEPVAVIMVDVDRFKSVNDTWGHPAGDAVLRAVGGALAEAAPEGAMVARYGGEEFAIVLVGDDAMSDAEIAEQLRLSVEALRVDVSAAAEALAITASFGVARSTNSTESALLFDHADSALYAAKRGGRNQVKRATGQENARAA